MSLEKRKSLSFSAKKRKQHEEIDDSPRFLRRSDSLNAKRFVECVTEMLEQPETTKPLQRLMSTSLSRKNSYTLQRVLSLRRLEKKGSAAFLDQEDAEEHVHLGFFRQVSTGHIQDMSQRRFTMNPFTLWFRDKSVESEYWLSSKVEHMYNIRIMSVMLTVMCLLLFIVNDLIMPSSKWALWITSLFRMSGCILLLIAFLITFIPRMEIVAYYLSGIGVFAVAVLNILGTFLGEQRSITFASPSDCILVFGLFCWLMYSSQSFITKTAGAIVLFILSEVVIFYLRVAMSGYSYLEGIGTTVMVIVIIIGGLYTAYHEERVYRDNFILSLKLAQESVKLKARETKNDMILLNVFPQFRKSGMMMDSYFKTFENVAILYSDLVGFTAYSSIKSASEVVDAIGMTFEYFDDLTIRHYCEKLKTVGDAYIVYCGAFDGNNPLISCVQICRLGMDMQKFMNSKKNKFGFKCRVGIHVGKVHGGFLTAHKYAFDLYGETLQIANLMEQLGAPGKVKISQQVADFVKNEFTMEKDSVHFVNGVEYQSYFLQSVKQLDIDLVTDELNRTIPATYRSEYTLKKDINGEVTKKKNIVTAVNPDNSCIGACTNVFNKMTLSSNPITLSFTDPQMEKDFTKNWIQNNLNYARIAYLISFCIFFVSAAAGFATDQAIHWYHIIFIVGMRIAFFTIGVLCQFLLFFKRMKRHAQLIFSFSLVIQLVILLLSLSVIDVIVEPLHHEIREYFMVEFIVYTMFTVIILRMKFLWIIFSIALSTLGFFVWGLIYDIGTRKFAIVGIVIAFTSAIAAYQENRNDRRSFFVVEQIEEEKNALKRCKKQSEKLLRNIFPENVLQKLAEGHEGRIAYPMEDICIMFVEVVTKNGSAWDWESNSYITLKKVFEIFDRIVIENKIEKIKTDGLLYMAAGLHQECLQDPSIVPKAALQMIDEVHEATPDLDIKIGLNCGSCVCGIVGKLKYCFDIWGDAVNVASRMCKTSENGKIQVTAAVRRKLKARFDFKERGKVVVKGKRQMVTYFLEKKNELLRRDFHPLGVPPTEYPTL